MKISEDRIGDFLLVSPETDKLDSPNSAVFKSWLMGLINQGEKMIALDFSDVRFMDSSGLAVLVSAFKVIGDTGKIVLVSPTENIRKLFSITKMDSFITILNSPDDLL
jgi:anti-sigma B factor antagonist